jgi:hypothetical protein
MMKIINLKTGRESEISVFQCNVCNCSFSEQEGGLHNGVIGMIPVAFCPTCLSGLFSMVDYLRGHNGDCDDDE